MKNKLQIDDMPNKMLIVDDDELIQDMLTQIFASTHDIIVASDGREGLRAFDNNRSQICAIMMDLNMPVMGGTEMLAELAARDVPGKVPIFLITAQKDDAKFSFTKEAYDLGVMDVISKPLDPDVIIRRVQTVIELFARRNFLNELVQQQTAELVAQNRLLEDLNFGMIEALATATEFRSAESGEHVRRIHDITYLFLTESPLNQQFDEDEIKNIARASILHDVGKISIEDRILNKPGKFNDEEFALMKMHTINGEKMLTQMHTLTRLPFYDHARAIARWHHERWDGRGYPDQLAGNDIPLSAQIVSIADVYDALVSTRVYKPPFTHDQTVSMILHGQCGIFNPMLLEYFEAIASKIEALYKHKNKISSMVNEDGCAEKRQA